MTLPDCSVSPSDMQGQIDNIMTRLAGLEEAVAGLASTDVDAIQLSDISPDVGWVYNVTYMGVSGWTQTAAGTLIPPPGMSLSSLGIVLGGNSIGSGSGSSLPTAIFQANVGAIADGPTGTNFSWTTIENSTVYATNNTSYITLSSGLYLLTMGGGLFSRSSSTGTSVFTGYVGSNVVANSQMQIGGFFASSESTTSRRALSGALVSRFPDSLSNSNIYGFAQKTGTTVSLSVAMLGITKLHS